MARTFKAHTRPATKSRVFCFLLATLVAMAFTGCGKKGDQTAAGKTENVLRYAVRVDPPSLDPTRIQDVYSAEAIQNVYEGLTLMDADNKPAPCLAEKWEISADGKLYTFHLRKGVKFHNGDPFTAADVKMSMERSLWPETKSPTGPNYLNGVVGLKEVVAGKTKDLSGVKIVDDFTVTIELDKSRAYFLAAISYISNSIVSKRALSAHTGSFDKSVAIGTGPFRIERFDSGSMLVLAANDNYWGGRPKLDRIERPVVVNMQTAHAKYESGETDVCETTSTDVKTDTTDERLKKDSRIVPLANTWYVAFHPRLEPKFADVRVRRAIAMAIDRDEISRVSSFGVLPRADGFLPPGMPGYNPSIKKISYDPAAAQKLLAEAGFPGGAGFPKLTLVYAEGTPEVAAAAQRIRTDLKANLGIEVLTQERELGSFVQDTGDKEKVAFYITGWVADYIDPQDFLSTMLRTGAALNHVAFSNAKFDALCDEADGSTDQAKRVQLYQQADQICVDEVGFLPIMYGVQPILVKPRVKGWKSNLMFISLPLKSTTVSKGE